MYQGGCLCSAIGFAITGPIRNIVYCHCSQCRKAQGSAYATNGIVQSQHFTITAGSDQLNAYESSPGQTRFACRICSSPIISKNLSKPGQLRIRLGTIDSDISEKPQAHIFVSSKASWDQITDELPQYDSYEPER